MFTSEKVLPYVYKLTHKSTGQFYFGSRYSKDLTYPSHIDIMRYQSSSKAIKELGFENFEVKILAEFFHPDDAWEFEQQLINEFYADPLILNKCRFKDGSLKFIFKHQSDKGKQHLRNLFKGRVFSEEHKLKLKLAKQSEPGKGTKNSQYGKKFKFVNNGSVQKKVNIDNLSHYLAQGWTLGRLPQANRNRNYKKNLTR